MAQTTWLEDITFKPQYSPLKKNIKIDVAIVGAGITGATAAYLLAKAGKKVALFEKGLIGEQSVTSYTTGFLSMFTDNGLVETVETFGARYAKMVWQSQQEAIRQIAAIVKEENIDCEFTRCSEYFCANNHQQALELKEETKQARKMGFKVDFNLDGELNLPNYGYMEVKNQAKIHPTKYLLGLIKAAREKGAQIYENTEIQEMESNNEVVLITKKSRITAKKVLVATHDPVYNPLEVYAKKGIYKTYVYEVEIAKGIFKEATYDDADNPYHYFRVDSLPKNDRMIIGGEDHREDIRVPEAKNFKALEEYLQKVMQKREYKIVKKWSGPIIEPIDGLPLIGWVNKTKNLFIATAFSGTGLTFGTVSGIMFKREVMGEKNPWKNIFDPNRIPTIKQLWQKGKDYSSELLGGAATNIFK